MAFHVGPHKRQGIAGIAGVFALLYGERLDVFQKTALALAGVGVANQAYRVGALSWEVLVVSLGFPVYFILRRKLATDHLGGLWFDVLFMLPAAVTAVCVGEHGVGVLFDVPRLVAQLPLLGAISAFSIACLITASKLLPMGLFGLLSYVEPVLLVLVSLLLGEHIAADERLTYLGVGLALAVLAFGALRNIRFST